MDSLITGKLPLPTIFVLFFQPARARPRVRARFEHVLGDLLVQPNFFAAAAAKTR